MTVYLTLARYFPTLSTETLYWNTKEWTINN